MTSINDQTLTDRTDEFVSSLDRTERVAWLKRQGLTDVQILDALLGGQDPELDELTRDRAHRVAIAAADGEITTTPEWLR